MLSLLTCSECIDPESNHPQHFFISKPIDEYLLIVCIQHSFQVRNYVDDLRLEKKILHCFGIYPKEKSKLSKWHRARMIITIIYLILHEAQIFSNAFHSSFSDSTTSVEWPLLFCFIMKLTIFSYYSNVILEVEESLRQTILSTYSESYCFVDENMELIKIFTKIDLCAIVANVSIFMFYEPLSANERRLPNAAPCPCDSNNLFCFLGFYVFQATGSYLTGILMASIDCLFCKLATICSCLFEVLYSNLKNIDYGKNTVTLEELSENVKRHQEILR